MNRLTEKGVYVSYVWDKKQEKIHNKLVDLEDLMEKYEINSIEELEEILKDYDDMAKDVVEMATGRKVDIKQ